MNSQSRKFSSQYGQDYPRRSWLMLSSSHRCVIVGFVLLVLWAIVAWAMGWF